MATTHIHDARNAGHCQACRDANRDLSLPTCSWCMATAIHQGTGEDGDLYCAEHAAGHDTTTTTED